MELEPGNFAPGFAALAVAGDYGESGRQVTLGEFAGQHLVLYFYPKDDTPGCIVQACGLRDAWEKLHGKAAVLGVSPDGAESHVQFVEKHRLPFPLLVDEGHQIAAAYGVWVEKEGADGHRHWGVERSTFVIGPDGRLVAVARKVNPETHAEWLTGILGG